MVGRLKSIPISELHGRGSQNIFLLLFFLGWILFLKKKKKKIIFLDQSRAATCCGARATVMNQVYGEGVERDRFITIPYFNIFFFFECV